MTEVEFITKFSSLKARYSFVRRNPNKSEVICLLQQSRGLHSKGLDAYFTWERHNHETIEMLKELPEIKESLNNLLDKLNAEIGRCKV